MIIPYGALMIHKPITHDFIKLIQTYFLTNSLYCDTNKKHYKLICNETIIACYMVGIAVLNSHATARISRNVYLTIIADACSFAHVHNVG